MNEILQTLFANPGPIEKVIAYITGGSRLLVFSERDFPEAGIQTPGGSVEEGEDLAHAVLREAHEETGLEGLRVARSLGSKFHFAPDGRILRRHYFHLVSHGDAPEQWEHWENFPNSGEPRVRLRLWWVDAAQPPELAGGLGALLPLISSTFRA